MMALVCFSCYTDEAVMNPEIKFNPEEASSPYVIPVEEALQTLTTTLERIDGSTRSGRMRSPLSVDRVKLAEAVAITRSAELPDVEDLFYIVSFGEGNGSAGSMMYRKSWRTNTSTQVSGITEGQMETTYTIEISI